MLKIPTTFTTWLAGRGNTQLHYLAFNSLRSATTNFLLEAKLVTKSFTMGFAFVKDQAYTSETKKMLRVLLVNIKKRLPLLKKENEAYLTPFAIIRNRSNCLDVQVSANTARGQECWELLYRYLTRYKIYAYLNSHAIPMVVTLHRSEVTVNVENPSSGFSHSTTPILIVRFSCTNTDRDIFSRSISTNANNDVGARLAVPAFPMFLLLFRLPEILKILTTLHRLAVFKE